MPKWRLFRERTVSDWSMMSTFYYKQIEFGNRQSRGVFLALHYLGRYLRSSLHVLEFDVFAVMSSTGYRLYQIKTHV